MPAAINIATFATIAASGALAFFGVSPSVCVVAMLAAFATGFTSVVIDDYLATR